MANRSSVGCESYLRDLCRRAYALRLLDAVTRLCRDRLATVYTLASWDGQTGNVREGPASRPRERRRFQDLYLQILNVNMKRSTLFHVLVATAFSVLLMCPALARQGTKMDPDAKAMTIEGAVRDLACPIQNPAGTATDRKSTRLN